MSVGHYENFPVASFLVPADLRPAIVALYRFARAADDIADEGDAAPAERLARLAHFDASLAAIAAGATPRDAPFPALAAAIRRHGLPIAPLHDLVSAFRQDVTVKRYATDAELDDYCRRSADPVGRMVLALYRADTAANVVASDAICTALQRANFWQDIAVDWRIGRVYVPRARLAAHGLDEGVIARAADDGAIARPGDDGATTRVGADPRWRALMRALTDDTRARFARGAALPGALPWRQRLELRAVIAGGVRILARIDAVGGDVFRRRPALRARDWVVVMARALAPA
jgi:squalene synthase HpnC